MMPARQIDDTPGATASRRDRGGARPCARSPAAFERTEGEAFGKMT